MSRCYYFTPLYANSGIIKPPVSRRAVPPFINMCRRKMDRSSPDPPSYESFGSSGHNFLFPLNAGTDSGDSYYTLRVNLKNIARLCKLNSTKPESIFAETVRRCRKSTGAGIKILGTTKSFSSRSTIINVKKNFSQYFYI